MKGYIPRITASRHLIGKDSLVISFAVSINLEQKQNSFQSFQLEQSKSPLVEREPGTSSSYFSKSWWTWFSPSVTCQSPLDVWRMTGGEKKERGKKRDYLASQCPPPLKVDGRNAILSASRSNSKSITSDCNTKPCWTAQAGNRGNPRAGLSLAYFQNNPGSPLERKKNKPKMNQERRVT